MTFDVRDPAQAARYWADLLGRNVGEEILAFTQFPRGLWRQIWSNYPNQRLNREIRRRTDVVGIFPDRGSISA